MYHPISTYRIQLNKDFTLSHLENYIPYLAKLGVKTIYASPIFTAVKGSTHGYDAVSFNEINPEIGTEEQLLRISKQLALLKMGWLQDIVPNHMAFHHENKYLMDVLEKGQRSEYFNFFDFLQDIKGGEKIMVPFLGSELEEAIEQNEITIRFEGDRLHLKYGEQLYPLRPSSYKLILDSTDNLPEPLSLYVNNTTADEYEHWDAIKSQLSTIDTSLKEHLQNVALQTGNNKQRLRDIIEQQHYRLCHWQETDKNINYRRFFTINGLIGVRVEDQRVFKIFHKKTLEFIQAGIFQGIRLDHIDGLNDPTTYLQNLRSHVGKDVYITVEKILDHEETIKRNWPIQGNTGYDFLAMSNKLLANGESEKQFTKLYNKRITVNSFDEELNKRKANILFNSMGGELDNLYQLFCKLQLIDNKLLEELGDTLKTAIAELLISLPVYRFYSNHIPLEEDEETEIKKLLDSIKIKKPQIKLAVNTLEDILLNKPYTSTEDYNQRVIHFYKRCMQFTGPLMAKGNEDTLMYTYNRFLGHNDVGDTALTFNLPIKAFHEKMKVRETSYPLSQNATSTHDTKRGEDVRARLSVLTDLTEQWRELVRTWDEISTNITDVEENDKYHIYQMIVGTYPMPGKNVQNTNFAERLKAYATKALREGKQNSSWASPNETYETSVHNLIDLLLNDNKSLNNKLAHFHKKICDYGIIASLTQLILKFTCPGVPDLYQGTELWDLSMVDPDNRSAVDFSLREQLLKNLLKNEPGNEYLKQLWDDRYDGQIKLWLTTKLLHIIAGEPDTFSQGLYVPLKVEGMYKNNIIAYLRQYQESIYLIILPLHIAELAEKQEVTITEINWHNTSIILPEHLRCKWQNLLTKDTTDTSANLNVQDAFQHLPFAILQMKPVRKKRSSGVLLSITSLPSEYGIGNLGKEAKEFAQFLSQAGQKLWQLLPLNPIDAGSAYSPYSSISSMAGNTLLIDPEWFYDRGLLKKDELAKMMQANAGKVNYNKIEKERATLFDIIYQRYSKQTISDPSFANFCEREQYWLEDYALFKSLQTHFNTPWYEWPNEYKRRDEQSLEKYAAKHSDEIEAIKWFQYIFYTQWNKLKDYCHALNIRLLGDLPFYISYNSAEVWARPDLFCLDEDFKIKGIAGVPPDYFSEDGQLWGMPTFNWEALKKENYKWWSDRLKKNLEMYDILRLDHFRAFASYWQVPAGEHTARNGSWEKGPGADFFTAIKKDLGKLPFVAEDLGDNMDEVYLLRDEIGLPGMKVLQFAFGEYSPESVDAPHNYTSHTIVYTGTHDNNTAVGWYRDETGRADHLRLADYTQMKISAKNIHKVLGRIAYASVADTVILPMQDVLGLDETSRMNTPGTTQHNWIWRLHRKQLDDKIATRLLTWVRMYNRG